MTRITFKSACGLMAMSSAALMSLVLGALSGQTWAARYLDDRPSANVGAVSEDDELVEVGKLAFENDCLMCHGTAIVNQQRLTPAQWKAEIQKMVGLGATVPDDDLAGIQAYLEASFGPNNLGRAERISFQAKGQGELESVPEPLAMVNADQGRTVFAEQCAKCHGADARGGEPGQNLVESVALLAVEPFQKVVREGRRKMPGFTGVISDNEARHILAWLRTLNYDPLTTANTVR